MGHSFLNSAPFLDVYNVTPLAHLYVVCNQRNKSVFPKRPRAHRASVLPLSLLFVVWVGYWKMAAMAERGA